MLAQPRQEIPQQESFAGAGSDEVLNLAAVYTHKQLLLSYRNNVYGVDFQPALTAKKSPYLNIRQTMAEHKINPLL